MADLPIEDLPILTVASSDDVLVIVDSPLVTPVTKQITKANFLGGTNIVQVVGTTETQTLTNKTLTTPIIASISNTGTITLPTATTTLVGRDTTDTLVNKTLTTPSIAQILNTGLLTLPTATTTLVGRTTTDTLTNKTLTDPVITINGGAITFPNGVETLVGLTATQTLTNKTLTAQIVDGGLTATGSASNDFSSSTGTFKTSTGTNTIGGDLGMAATKKITPSVAGGIEVLSGQTAPTVNHSGGIGASTTTQGTDTTPATTETYICEVFIPVNATLTGVSLLNGSAVAGNITVGLASASGAVLATSNTTTAQSGTAAYQQIPFTSTFAVKGPSKAFILIQCSNTSARFRTHILGNFGASKKTGETYGTFTAITPPTTFTTNLGPVADTY